MEDVSIYIDELVMEHPAAASDPHAAGTQLQPLTDRLGPQVIAEIRHAVDAVLGAESAQRYQI